MWQGLWRRTDVSTTKIKVEDVDEIYVDVQAIILIWYSIDPIEKANLNLISLQLQDGCTQTHIPFFLKKSKFEATWS